MNSFPVTTRPRRSGPAELDRSMSLMPATTGPRATPPVHLDLIRGFELRCGSDVVAVKPSSQRLIAFVALHDRAVRRTHVSGVLWLDASEGRANASLRSALWRTPGPGGDPVVSASSTHLWLNPEVEVDFRQTVTRARRLLAGEAEPLAPTEIGDDLARFGEDLLPDWYDDWVIVERERFRQLRLHALEQICGRLADEGRFGEAIQAGLAAVAAEPLRESAHRQVVQVHLREGNVGEALRQYRTYARLLRDELGLTPSPTLQALVERHLHPDPVPAP